MNLFQEENDELKEPLAHRMRPRTLEEVVGQSHILAKDKLLYRAIQADRLSSLILTGPTGTGKTSLAMVIAHSTKSNFEQVNATIAGKKDLEKIVEEARNYKEQYGKKTILFIDEIHRFNKAQQDYLLPFVEEGLVTLIGATTENPYFEVNRALLSRSTVFQLKPLSKEDIVQLLKRACADHKRGMAVFMPLVQEDVYSFLAQASDGDARVALNALELAILTTDANEEGYREITLEIASECIQRKVLRYDKDGDNHYDTISAFIKSMRGSDPDATIYYLARMLEAGEDERFIARRIMICASEDVGNADPRAIEIATSCALAMERVGLPEATIILAQACTYVACAPKSNASYLALHKAQEAVKKYGNLPIPAYLKNIVIEGEENIGKEKGYQYAHDYPHHYVEQQYLPDAIRKEVFYRFSDNAYEAKLKKYFAYIGKKKIGKE
ncbi:MULTISPECIES: replication-associated recombination protein A [Terrabacteria group]|uniref:replication-associated recombination protein A n=1 Tax=Bacillati TaxID=1783272 RepID=UPI00193A05DF|nr:MULTISPECIES: replication-associated recombination protein A [Terrabacteria group]MBW9212279.1 replication-associated recombination protein A [Trueperella sp. zg.1013]QRG86181.1 replication-associated recombination protein A [Bulleidia sp. zg-1006]